MIYDFIKIFSNQNESIVNQCNFIAHKYNKKNGGILEFDNLASDSKYIICALKNNKVIGFLCLKEYEAFPNSIYVELIATDKEYLKLGIATDLINYSIDFGKKNKYKSIIANVKKTNQQSHNLFIKLKFSLFNMKEEEYLSLGFSYEQILINDAFVLNLI